MSDAIIVALITGAITLIGTIITVRASASRQTAEMDKKIAVVESQISDMKEDIKSHNGYAKMFSEAIPAIKQHMKDVDRRLEIIERK